MAKGKVIVDSSAFDKQVLDIQKYIDETLVKQMVAEYKKNTPIASGNARRKTKRKGNSVIGDYAYAGVLDDGLFPNPPKAGTGKTVSGFSRQAPKGMYIPTLEYVEKQLEAFIKRSNK
jgi:hypothetical protein